MSAYQPFTGAICACRPGVHRDNCPRCEGTGRVVDFAAIHARKAGAVMSAAKHTPGPWVVESDGVSIAIGRVVCITNPSPDGAPIGETRANARLISAAPDLLAALVALAGPDGDLHNQANLTAARAAIAKARGGAK